MNAGVSAETGPLAGHRTATGCGAVALPDVEACETCDMVQRAIPLRAGGAGAGVAVCRRCGGPLYRRGHPDRALALIVAALVLFAIAAFHPIAAIDTQGRHNAASLPTAVGILWADGMPLLAVLVLATTLLLPLLELCLLAGVLLALRRGRASRPVRLMLRAVGWMHPWGMVEVFMLGVLVSLVKLAHLAQVLPGVALWSYGVLMLLLTAISANIDMRALWAMADGGQDA